MSIFDKMNLDDKLEYKLSEKDEETLRENDTVLIKKIQEINRQIQANDKAARLLQKRRAEIEEKYK